MSPTTTSSVRLHRPVTGMPRRLLRLEGAALLLCASLAYGLLGEPWLGFALLFFAPDLSILGYFGGPRVGAWTYNLGHTTLAPILAGGLGLWLDSPAWPWALIWLAHIGFDRALGFGLKYPAGFRATHLQLFPSNLRPTF